jgi:hypothetical protein
LHTREAMLDFAHDSPQLGHIRGGHVRVEHAEHRIDVALANAQQPENVVLIETYPRNVSMAVQRL